MTILFEGDWRVRSHIVNAIVTFFPYQLAFGITVRWFEGGPHLRLYVGPVKFALGAWLPGSS